MQVTKTLIALAVAAGFASTAFAQGAAPATPATPAAPASKVTAPAPAAAEKKVEAPAATAPAKTDVGASEAAKPAKKVMKHHGKAKKAEMKGEATPAAK